MRGFRIVKRRMTRWECLFSMRSPHDRLNTDYFFIERETPWGGWRKFCIDEAFTQKHAGRYTGGYSMYAFGYDSQRLAERALSIWCAVKATPRLKLKAQIVAEFEFSTD